MGGLKMGTKGLCVPHEDKYSEACPDFCIMCKKPLKDRSNEWLYPGHML